MLTLRGSSSAVAVGSFSKPLLVIGSVSSSPTYAGSRTPFSLLTGTERIKETIMSGGLSKYNVIWLRST